MSYAYPAALALLLGLPVIVWLHLRRRRPRRLLVPAIAPWQILLSAVPPRRRQVPPNLLLLLHLAAAGFLALAALGPRGPGNAASTRDRVLVLDRSASMTAAERWPEALARAEALLDATSGERSLVALDDRPRVLVARDADGRAARAALSSLRPDMQSGADLDAALMLARAAAGPAAEIVVIGDAGLSTPAADAPAARLERVGAAEPNLGITHAALRRTGGELDLFVRVASFADARRELGLSLHADGREIDQVQLSLGAGDTHEAAWRLPPRSGEIELRLRSGDAWPGDDLRRPALEVGGPRIQISGASAQLARALAALPGASLQSVGLGDYRAEGSVDLSVFVGEAPVNLPPGGVLLVDPEPGGPMAVSGDPSAARITRLGAQPLVAGLDLSGVSLEGLRAIDPPPGAEILMWAGESPALVAWPRAEGRLLVMAFDPEGGALADRLAFPLLVARSVAWLTAPMAGLAPTLPLSEHDLRQGGGDWPEPEASVDATRGGGRPLWPWLAGLAICVMLAEGAWRAGFLKRVRPERPDRGPR